MQVSKTGFDRYDRGSDHDFSKVNDFSYFDNSQVQADPRTSSEHRSAPHKIDPTREKMDRSYSIERELQEMA